MNKYAVYEYVNGTFILSSEHSTLQAAIIAFHQLSAALWNAEDITLASIAIVDENLYVVDGKYLERIDKSIESNE